MAAESEAPPSGLRAVLAGPVSLGRTLALALGGLLLLSIFALALGGAGLLREQAEEQALSRVQLAGIAARDLIRRSGESALTSARLLASRPTLARLARAGNSEQLGFFVRRYCETAGLSLLAAVASDAIRAAMNSQRDTRGQQSACLVDRTDRARADTLAVKPCIYR